MLQQILQQPIWIINNIPVIITMGNLCESCLKQSELPALDQAAHILSDSRIAPSDIRNRTTQMLQTGLFCENTTFYITTEPLLTFKCQYLLILSDSLPKITRNPFIRQLKPTTKAGLEDRIQYLKDKTEFNKSGDYINISEPFGNTIKISNLMVVCMQLFDPHSIAHQKQSLKKSIQLGLDNIVSNTTDNLCFGVLEISHHLGYSLGEFREHLKNKIEEISRSKKQVKVVYFAQSRENIGGFIDTMLGPRHDLTMTLAKSYASSSYF